MHDSVFPTIRKLADEIGAEWHGFDSAAKGTAAAEGKLRTAIQDENGDRLLNSDASLVLFGSFARHEMLDGSDYDWSLLIDGVVDNDHAELARRIAKAVARAELKSPGSSGTFGNLVFSHELVHQIGGGTDSNPNLTRRMLMLLESRPFSVSSADSSQIVWDNVLRNILERYFEEEVHFASAGDRKVPRFLLNDLTRYWRTMGVDYAAKHREQDGKKWAIRNAKLRFSRKLLFASGLAFCLSCQLPVVSGLQPKLFGTISDEGSDPFIQRAFEFSKTPPLEYLAAFLDEFVESPERRKSIATRVFGAYDWWLTTLGDEGHRKQLESLSHAEAESDCLFEQIRTRGKDFGRGLEALFFGRDRDEEHDRIAKLSLEYIGF